MSRSFLTLKMILGNSNVADCISHWIWTQGSGLERWKLYSLPVVSATGRVYVFYLWGFLLSAFIKCWSWISPIYFFKSTLPFHPCFGPGRLTCMSCINWAPWSFGCHLGSACRGSKAGGERDLDVYFPYFLPTELEFTLSLNYTPWLLHAVLDIGLFSPVPVTTLLLLVTGLLHYLLWFL